MPVGLFSVGNFLAVFPNRLLQVPLSSSPWSGTRKEEGCQDRKDLAQASDQLLPLSDAQDTPQLAQPPLLL